MAKEPSTYKPIVRNGVTVILIGLVAIMSSLYDGAPNEPRLVRTLLDLLETVGIFLIGYGLFEIMLGTNDWVAFFGHRIREVVIEQSYLGSLDRHTLDLLERRVLKALFPGASVNREGSFLNYYCTALQPYVGEPYREDVTLDMEMQEHLSDRYKYLDRVTYLCRRGGTAIQPTISWHPDPGEIEQLDSLIIKVQYPAHHPNRGNVVVLFDSGVSGLPSLSMGVRESLSKYADVDGLAVTVESRYWVRARQFQYWQMAHPTRNLQFVLSFPKGYAVQIKPLVLHQDLCQTFVQSTVARMKYDAWMLPQSGVAWLLTPPATPVSQSM